MAQPSIQAIVLAAGKSKRLNSGKSKLLEKICGQEMVLYPLELFKELGISPIVVLGHEHEKIEPIINSKNYSEISFVHQAEQLGTGHAVMCALHHLQADDILIINGDMPLVTPNLINQLIEKHRTTQAAISFVTAHNSDPSLGSYGRVIQDNDGVRVLEAKEFTGDANIHCCVNAGIYLVKKDYLITTLASLQKNATSAEFQIPDLINIASAQKLIVTSVAAPFDEVRGVNTYKELWATEQIKKSELITYWMNNGVRFASAHYSAIEIDVTIGAGTYIASGAHITKGSRIGQNCTIGEFTLIENSTVADECIILSHCVIKDSHVHAGAEVGPFAHMRNHAQVGEKTVIGNFVELKNSHVGMDTKIKHLSYLGDATVGNNVNIGAGTITCNHNGILKQKTIIEDSAYVGANNTLVAPVTLGANCFTAAGSVITENVPPNALGIGRSRQINKDGYALKLKKKKEHNTQDSSVYRSPQKPMQPAE